MASINAIPDGGYRLADGDSQAFLEDKFVDTVRKLMSELRWNQWKDNAYSDDVSMMDALCRILCCNRFSEFYLPFIQGLPRLPESQEYVFSIIKSNASPHYKPYYDSVVSSTKGRGFFTTAEGHIGLAPRRIRPGDQVCIVLGC